MAPTPHPSAQAQSLADRVTAFVSENKRAVLIGAAAAALAAGGVAYYASTSRAHGGAGALPPGSPADAEEEKEKKAKDKKKKSKKRKTVKDPDGPILEEREPSVADVEEDRPLTAEEVAALPLEERTKLAASLKTRGNTAYQKRQFETAADLYTRAIQISSKPEPVFYSNRAACYMNMSPPKYESVIEDCDVALKLDSTYVKALNRRGSAYESLSQFELGLRDFTAATILDKFQNEQTAQSVERVLKKLATAKAGEILLQREKRLPSHTFVSAYFAAFRQRPLPTLPENPETGDNTLIMALEALGAGDYTHAMSLVNEAMDQGVSWDEGRAEALNLRGTFKFLLGDISGAKDDLQASIDVNPSLTQSWVKIASVHMEQGDPKQAFECFESAIKHNPDDPDTYYHRGQVLFIMNEFKDAAENYTKSTALDEQFVFSHIQLAVAQYKMGDLAKSMATFRRTLKAFPQRSEPQNYYGELLLDQGRFEDAVEKFDKAIELEKNRPPPMNVLPLVNKGLAIFQWKQDVSAAEECCQDALKIDDECEAAVATLAQLALQQGKIAEAIGLFKRQTELSRSEPELINALTYYHASAAQLEFVGNYPHMASQLSSMARSMV